MGRQLTERVWGRLQADGLRRTPQREAVLEALDDADEALPLPVILARARRRAPGLGERTVERTLRLLTDRGAVDAIHRGTGEVAFRLCVSRAHHHHLVCSRCGAVAELPECEVAGWAAREAERHGFAVEGHDLTIWGRCARCRAPAAPAPGQNL
ncbi:MAG: transcriptional repressor [Thermoleophilia bacterium]|jgi:Fur family ferric uptake transcriptional regulator|nr:transcriptional repressor [Thermoleophilia bacterium]